MASLRAAGGRLDILPSALGNTEIPPHSHYGAQGYLKQGLSVALLWVSRCMP